MWNIFLLNHYMAFVQQIANVTSTETVLITENRQIVGLGFAGAATGVVLGAATRRAVGLSGGESRVGPAEAVQVGVDDALDRCGIDS